MVLVFDIGTTAVKGALFERDGNLSAVESRSVTLKPSADPNTHEIDPEEWLLSIKSIISGFMANFQGPIEAIVVSGNGPTLVPSDENGKALMPAMTWMDRRGVEEAEILKEKNGVYIDPTFYLPKAFWVARNRPGIYEKTSHFFSCPEYVAFYLTGEAAMVFPGEGLEFGVWTDDLIGSVDLDHEKFPPLVFTGHSLGRVTATAAQQLQIEKGIPVFAGGPDFIMALLGTASVKPGRACDRAGTSEGINVCSEKKIADSRLLCYRHVARDFWNITGIISTSGKALEWFKNSAFGKETTFPEMLARLKNVPSGSNKLVFLPYLTGERAPVWDPRARGVFLGLTLQHGIEEMGHAILESVGYAIRDVLTVMEEKGIVTDELRITGNPAKSKLWNQLKADISGKSILVPETGESELTGDLCVALFGLGDYKTPAEASDTIVKFAETYTPDKGKYNLYEDLFSVYRESYTSLKHVFTKLADIHP